MGINNVVWNTGDLITETKLDEMVANGTNSTDNIHPQYLEDLHSPEIAGVRLNVGTTKIGNSVFPAYGIGDIVGSQGHDTGNFTPFTVLGVNLEQFDSDAAFNATDLFLDTITFIRRLTASVTIKALVKADSTSSSTIKFGAKIHYTNNDSSPDHGDFTEIGSISYKTVATASQWELITLRSAVSITAADVADPIYCSFIAHTILDSQLLVRGLRVERS